MNAACVEELRAGARWRDAPGWAAGVSLARAAFPMIPASAFEIGGASLVAYVDPNCPLVRAQWRGLVRALQSPDAAAVVGAWCLGFSRREEPVGDGLMWSAQLRCLGTLAIGDDVIELLRGPLLRAGAEA